MALCHKHESCRYLNLLSFFSVNPSPSYPVFEGCNHYQYCVLDVDREGTLLCSLSGIRPAVKLNMESDYEDGIISFSRQNMETIERDDVFDIYLHVWYSIHSEEKNGRIAVDCSASGRVTLLHIVEHSNRSSILRW